MDIGGHSVNHPVLSKLDRPSQHYEVNRCLETLNRIAPNQDRSCTSFCFPYGGTHSYNSDTLELLKLAGIRCCFDVRNQPGPPLAATLAEFTHNILRLPRFDCNEIHGGMCNQQARYRTLTVFTSNQKRHLHLLKCLSQVADTVFAVIEATPTTKKLHSDPTMREYFDKVSAAETEIFGSHVEFLPSNVKTLALTMGDATACFRDSLMDHSGPYSQALQAEYIFVFGASWLKGDLIKMLMRKGALNLHAGISPYFRGSATNFWSVNDSRADLTGLTLHFISEGLDSGPIVSHFLPRDRAGGWDPFLLGMEAIRAGHLALTNILSAGQLPKYISKAVHQSGKRWGKSQQIRYARNADFTKEVAEIYLQKIANTVIDISKRDLSLFVNPYVW